METISDTYARYDGENHDLAISITARELGLEECCVREVIDAREPRNIGGPHPRVRPGRLKLWKSPDRSEDHYPTLA